VVAFGSTVAVGPRSTLAQPAVRVRKVSLLLGGAGSDEEWQRYLRSFEQELARLGWVKDRNLIIEQRWSRGKEDPFEALATELVKGSPDVLLTSATLGARALQRETRSIPIVFVNVADPVGSRLVPSLARPGGNMTGITAFEYGICGEWLEILRDLAPGASRVALLFSPETAPYAPGFWGALETAARLVGVTPVVAAFRTRVEIEQIVEAFAREPNGGLLAVPELATIDQRQTIIAMAARHRLPAVYPFRLFAQDGGLAAYGIDLVEQYRRVAGYVDRLLRGAKPEDLPVEAPTKFGLVINLKTARELGLDIAPSLLARADEVIE
jgi:ABC-type uncharacterized transport system substrate-binding protein